MDSGWTPGGRQSKRTGAKDTLDDLLGDLLEDDVQPKKKSVSRPAGRQTFGSKKQSSKDEDFYSSLAQAADEDDNMSDISEADVNQMAKSIADLDDLDADLFHTGGSTTSKTPKRGSLKEKSGKPVTPRRTGTPRSRSVTPRASSPPLRMSPANRVTSPTGRVTSPVGRVTSPPAVGRDTPTGINANRAGSGSKKTVPVSKPASPPHTLPEYKPSTAPGKMTDIGSASASLKPGSVPQEQERPRTVPKAKTYSFGEFDEDDPLAGIPISDEEDDIGLGNMSRPANKQQRPIDEPSSARSAPAPSTQPPEITKPKETSDTSQPRSLFDRPPTRSGSNTATQETEDQSTTTAAAVKSKPGPVLKKKMSEEAVFSDDDDFLGGLGIEEKSGSAKVKAKPTEIEDEESRPAKSIFDKLLGNQSVSKHLETKEKREFVLDTKYTQQKQENEGEEEDFQFGSYMPSAAASSSSRPTSKRSVRFQDDDDIFGISDKPPARTHSPAGKKADNMDWLEMASGNKTPEKPAPTPAEPTAELPKPKSNPSDWLGLTGADDDDDDDGFDFLKASSFSAPARQGQPTLPTSKTQQGDEKKRTLSESGPSSKPAPTKSTLPPKQSDPTAEQKPKVSAAEPKVASTSNNDYLGLGEEIDPSQLLRTKSESPVFGDGIAKKAVKDDVFTPPPPSSSTAEQTRGRTMFESGARRLSPRREMSPGQSPRRSPERKVNIEEPKETPSVPLFSKLKDVEKPDVDPHFQTPPAAPSEQSKMATPPPAPQAPQAPQATHIAPQDSSNTSTNFFSFNREELRNRRKEQPLQPVTQSVPKTGIDEIDARPSYPANAGQQFSQMSPHISSQPQSWTGSQPSYPSVSQQFSSVPLSPMTQTGYQQMKYSQPRMIPVQQPQYQPQMIIQQPQQMLEETYMVERPLFPENMDMDAQAQIRRLEVELEYSRDILVSTKKRYEEELMALENSYKGRLQLVEETQHKREQRWREENESLMTQQLAKVRAVEEEKSELISNHYKKLEEFERDKSQEIERLKDIQRQALDHLKKDHEESLVRLKRSKDQQIDAAASSHDTSKSLVAAVSMIQNNAKDLGELQKKMDSWHGQGLDEREILARSKDEQLRMLQERLNKQQEDNDQERQKLQDLIARLETQIREQTRMLEEERWKVKQEQGRLQGLQTALEEERRLWGEQQAKERATMEKSREALLEEQRTTLQQLHKERQVLAEEQIQFNVSQKMTREEHGQMTIKAAQARAEFEALTRAIAEARDRYESQKEEIHREEERIDQERKRLDKERNKIENKETELIEAAAMMQGRSGEIEDMYTTGQQKYEEGMAALAEAQRIENEEAKRIDTINMQLNTLRMKEKEMSEERLRLSKEKREMEKFRNTLLCPNCRTPSRQLTNGNMNISPQMSPNQGLLMTTNGTPSNGYPVNNGLAPHGLFSPPANQTTFGIHPSMQLSVNTVDAVTESIKSDRAIRKLKMDAMKDQKYLEEQSMFLYTLKHMPYSSPKG